MNLLSEPWYERIAVERLRIGAQGRVSPYVLANLSVEVWTDHMTKELVYAFRSEVLAQRLDTRTVDQRVEWDTPASWWQMFKAAYALSWWLGWLVRRWPVRLRMHHKFVSIKYGVDGIYPDANIRLPEKDFGRPFIVNRVVQ